MSSIIEMINRDFNLTNIDYIIKEETNKSLDELPDYLKEKYNVHSKANKVCDLYKKDFILGLEYIKEKRIKGNPDTFLVAACLFRALMKNKPIRFSLDKETPEELVLINYRTIVNICLQLISNPVVYDNETMINLEEISIDIPESVIPNNDLKKHLIRIAAYNNIYGIDTDMPLLSYIFQLFYINSKRNQEVAKLQLNKILPSYIGGVKDE